MCFCKYRYLDFEELNNSSIIGGTFIFFVKLFEDILINDNAAVIKTFQL